MEPVLASCLPSWIKRLGVPAWIVIDGGIGWLNREAEELLGESRERSVGRPCHEVVRGLDAYCRVFCRRTCTWQKQLQENVPLEPFVLRLGAENRWCQVLPIAVEAGPKERWLLHCALDLGRARLLADYLARVASRTPHRDLRTYAELQETLTERELEVLRLLARDLALHDVADHLHVSYITVRNHVQHILHKLETHTIQQAVALYLLAWDRPHGDS